MRVPGLARKFWTITSWRWPCRSLQLREREQGVEPLLARLADPDQDPARERDPQLARAARSSPAGAPAACRARPSAARPSPRAAPASVSSMIPIEAETGRSAASSSRVITPGFRCGSRPVSSSTSRAHAAEVLERRLAAERAQLVARDLVAELRLVAEREERLGAAGRRARARDREHLVGGQVRALAAARRPGERAVAADVAAERRQRDEDLRRVGDEPAAAAPLARRREQIVERRVEHGSDPIYPAR